MKINSTFELIEGDTRDLSTCRAALEGIDYISHQAALGLVPRSIADPATTNEVNVSGFLNMLVSVKESVSTKRGASFRCKARMNSEITAA